MSDKEIAENIEKYVDSIGILVSENTAKLFIANFNTRWRQVNRTRQRFESKYEKWLDTPLYFDKQAKKRKFDNVGRPQTSFQNLSDSQKRRRTAST